MRPLETSTADNLPRSANSLHEKSAPAIAGPNLDNHASDLQQL